MTCQCVRIELKTILNCLNPNKLRSFFCIPTKSADIRLICDHLPLLTTLHLRIETTEENLDLESLRKLKNLQMFRLSICQISDRSVSIQILPDVGIGPHLSTIQSMIRERNLSETHFFSLSNKMSLRQISTKFRHGTNFEGFCKHFTNLKEIDFHISLRNFYGLKPIGQLKQLESIVLTFFKKYEINLDQLPIMPSVRMLNWHLLEMDLEEDKRRLFQQIAIKFPNLKDVRLNFRFSWPQIEYTIDFVNSLSNLRVFFLTVSMQNLADFNQKLRPLCQSKDVELLLYCDEEIETVVLGSVYCI